MDEQQLKSTFAKKLAYFRKSAGMTQSGLAEKLNYSDKSVSKWERAEGLPDVFVLTQISRLFAVPVDDLLNEKAPERPVDIVLNRRLITVIAAAVPWLVATIVFATLFVAGVPGVWPWLCFVYAVPVSAIVLIVFTAMWWGKTALAVSISVLLWSLVLCGVLTFNVIKLTSFFAVAAICQIIIVLIFKIKYKEKPIQNVEVSQ